jgi:formylglycine-generating enzyme required for sulfatase activity
MTNCGTSAAESCCTSLPVVPIEGGSFYRTYANNGTGPMSEGDNATISGLRVDKYLVTVGRFRNFVNVASPPDGGPGWRPQSTMGKHTHLNGGQGLVDVGGPTGTYEYGWNTADNGQIAPMNANLVCDTSYATWTTSPQGQENLPINCVNWYEAYAFCIWDLGFLPSTAEWEYTAAGGSQQLEYPWGSADPGMSSNYAIYGAGGDAGGVDCYYPTGVLSPCTGVTNIAPVGTANLGAGLWGQLDLAGELLEWNLDWSATYIVPCRDCAYLTAGSSTTRVRRGGYFNDTLSDLVPPVQHRAAPTNRGSIAGFRCARIP